MLWIFLRSFQRLKLLLQLLPSARMLKLNDTNKDCLCFVHNCAFDVFSEPTFDIQ